MYCTYLCICELIWMYTLLTHAQKHFNLRSQTFWVPCKGLVTWTAVISTWREQSDIHFFRRSPTYTISREGYKPLLFHPVSHKEPHHRVLAVKTFDFQHLLYALQLSIREACRPPNASAWSRKMYMKLFHDPWSVKYHMKHHCLVHQYHVSSCPSIALKNVTGGGHCLYIW